MVAITDRITQVIGPNEAAELLRYNTRNRPLSPSRVKRYANAMRNGKFTNNNDPVKLFMVDGGPIVLVNGQHRFHAIIQSGVGVELDIIYKAGTAAELAQEFVVQDGGKGRDARDAFATAYTGERGTYSSRDLAVVSRAIAMVDTLIVPNAVSGAYEWITNDDLVDIAQGHQVELLWGCGLRHIIKRETRTTLPVGILANAIESFRLDHNAATEFYSVVGTGENIASGMPAYTLRREIVGIRGMLSNQISVVRYWYNRAGYAWNAHVEGRSLFKFSAKADVWVHPKKPRIHSLGFAAD
jgi:hypothetical protein